MIRFPKHARVKWTRLVVLGGMTACLLQFNAFAQDGVVQVSDGAATVSDRGRMKDHVTYTTYKSRRQMDTNRCPSGVCGWDGNMQNFDRWCYVREWRQKTRDNWAILFGKSAPTGAIQVVYPHDPNYVDGRDTKVYSAPEQGIPMAIPVGPPVHSQYNYSHGVTGSRLTPISRPLP